MNVANTCDLHISHHFVRPECIAYCKCCAKWRANVESVIKSRQLRFPDFCVRVNAQSEEMVGKWRYIERRSVSRKEDDSFTKSTNVSSDRAVSEYYRNIIIRQRLIIRLFRSRQFDAGLRFVRVRILPLMTYRMRTFRIPSRTAIKIG